MSASLPTTKLVFNKDVITVTAPEPIAPISDNTSAVDLDSNPFAVNLAYSSSATDELSIFTALVLDMPKVSDA